MVILQYMQDKNADVKPVLKGRLVEAQLSAVMGDRAGTVMHSLQLCSSSGQKKLLYSPDEASASAWSAALQLSASSQPKHISDILTLDWSAPPLGAGLFATVHGAEEPDTKLPVALKVIKSSAYAEYAEVVEREAYIWSAVGSHPHIAALRAVYKSPKRYMFVTGVCGPRIPRALLLPACAAPLQGLP